jgi:hypothetical protein
VRYFFDAVESGKSARTDVHDGVKALDSPSQPRSHGASNGLSSWMFDNPLRAPPFSSAQSARKVKLTLEHGHW